MPMERGDSWFSPKCIEVQPRCRYPGGRALDGLGAKCGYQPQLNSKCQVTMRVSETMGAKLHRRKGNNPDHQLRSPNRCLVSKVVTMPRQPGCWLRSSHH